MRLGADFTRETMKANDIFQKFERSNCRTPELLTYQKISFKNKNKVETFQQTKLNLSPEDLHGKENAKGISK